MRAFARQTYIVAVVHRHNRPTACMLRVPHLSVGDADNRGYHQPDGFLVAFYLRHRRMSVEPVMDAAWLFTCTTYTPFGKVDKSSE